MANEAQIEAWNGATGQKWAQRQDRMDEMLAPLSRVAIDRAAASEGETVLDIGCGCGATSIALAANAASVVGYDISAPMLAGARERARGIDNVMFHEADASSVPLEPSADLLFSRFGVMFFDDPVGAFENLHSGMKTGGRVCLLVWRALLENEWMAKPLGAIRPFLDDAPAPTPGAPGPFAFADRDHVTDILTRAGFSNVALEALDLSLGMGGDANDAAREFSEMGPLASVLNEADNREKAMAAVQDVMAAHVNAGGAVEMKAACWIVTATA